MSLQSNHQSLETYIVVVCTDRNVFQRRKRGYSEIVGCPIFFFTAGLTTRRGLSGSSNLGVLLRNATEVFRHQAQALKLASRFMHIQAGVASASGSTGRKYASVFWALFQRLNNCKIYLKGVTQCLRNIVEITCSKTVFGASWMLLVEVQAPCKDERVTVIKRLRGCKYKINKK